MTTSKYNNFCKRYDINEVLFGGVVNIGLL